ncbi:Rv0909 family putative TA system antitoxin [Leucobacter sp. M11]|uniref:Rv0909 family putative TA system antitoxin n=1 Tax=Leucobacter sp. M11 TaxID=2993565 RepID=UPI002D809085|nr:Rv0909 family putative TA system antitoxin [Leucobacter sp. M11]MEB4614327.1 Rv0909 family putative TA system antitoxin [Leucobacter sp. M11]
MGLEDISKKTEELAKKAGDFVKQNADKADAAMKSDKAEEISDKVLGGVADLANKVTGGKYADKVEEVRSNIDKNLGSE